MKKLKPNIQYSRFVSNDLLEAALAAKKGGEMQRPPIFAITGMSAATYVISRATFNSRKATRDSVILWGMCDLGMGFPEYGPVPLWELEAVGCEMIFEDLSTTTKDERTIDKVRKISIGIKVISIDSDTSRPLPSNVRSWWTSHPLLNSNLPLENYVEAANLSDKLYSNPEQVQEILQKTPQKKIQMQQ